MLIEDKVSLLSAFNKINLTESIFHKRSEGALHGIKIFVYVIELCTVFKFTKVIALLMVSTASFVISLDVVLT